MEQSVSLSIVFVLLMWHIVRLSLYLALLGQKVHHPFEGVAMKTPWSFSYPVFSGQTSTSTHPRSNGAMLYDHYAMRAQKQQQFFPLYPQRSLPDTPIFVFASFSRSLRFSLY
jgi:hypothetical protein